MKKKLFRFLKENGVFREFLKEFKKQEGLRTSWSHDCDKFFSNSVSTVDSFCTNMKSSCDLIRYCFLWKDTKEGHDFWEKINNKWLAIFNEN